jgi:hypothetical protein
MFSQLVNNGNEMFSSIFNNANDMFTDIFNAPKAMFSDLFDDNEDDNSFLQMVSNASTMFADLINEKYNMVFEMYNELNAYIEKTQTHNMNSNELVYETSVLESTLFTQTTYDLTIVADDHSFSSPFPSPIPISVSNSTDSLVSQILNFGNTTINFIINEVTMVVSAIANNINDNNNKKDYISLLLNYKFTVVFRIIHYGSKRTLGEKGYDRIQWIARPDNPLNTYQVQCHYRDTTITITKQMAQSIVWLHGPFGKYHVINCDGDLEELNMRKIGLLALGFLFALCKVIVLIKSFLYSMLHLVKSILYSMLEPPSDYVSIYDILISESLRKLEAKNSFQCYYRKLPEIEIPKLDDDRLEQYMAFYKRYKTMPRVYRIDLSLHERTIVQKTITLGNCTFVLPEIKSPTDEEYATKFDKIYKHIRNTNDPEIPHEEIKALASVVTFHAFEVQFAKQLQHRNTLKEDFWRKIDLEIAERQRQEITDYIQELRTLNREHYARRKRTWGIMDSIVVIVFYCAVSIMYQYLFR